MPSSESAVSASASASWMRMPSLISRLITEDAELSGTVDVPRRRMLDNAGVGFAVVGIMRRDGDA